MTDLPATAPRIYLAGPEVFLPNALEVARELKALLVPHGLAGVFPLDNALADLTPDEATARRIFQVDLELLDSCHAVLAHMTPFRGPSMDVGTAFEMGYAYAQGKPIVAYTSALDTYVERVSRSPFSGPSLEVDFQGHHVENFNIADNLMVACSPKAVVPTAAEAAALLAALLRT